MDAVQLFTADGLRLEGLVYGPSAPLSRRPVVLVHGAATSMTRDPATDVLGRTLAAKGRSFLAVNNRGSGWITSAYRRVDGKWSQVFTGHALERFEECVLDIDAWIAFAMERGAKGVVVMGWSLGCQKLGYYLSERADPRVSGVIFAMPGDPVNLYRRQIGAARHRELTERAKSLAREGGGGELQDFGLADFFLSSSGGRSGGWDFRMSAEAYISLMGEDAPRDVFSYARADGGGLWRLGRIEVPILALSGDVNERIVGSPRDALQKIKSSSARAPRCDTVLLEGVSHEWLDHEREVADLIAKWLDEAVPDDL